MSRPLEYRRVPPRGSHRVPGLPFVIAIVVIPLIAYVLFQLQRMPYRPPVDMSTLLSTAEVRMVRALIVMLAGAWFCCAVALAMRGVRARWPRGHG